MVPYAFRVPHHALRSTDAERERGGLDRRGDACVTLRVSARALFFRQFLAATLLEAKQARPPTPCDPAQ